MKTLKQIKEEAGEEFDSTYKIVCSAHERTSSCKCICDELTDLNEEYQNIKKFWLSQIDKAVSEMEKSIRLDLKEKKIIEIETLAEKAGLETKCDYIDARKEVIQEQEQKIKEFKQ